MRIPFLNLAQVNKSVEEPLNSASRRVMQSGNYILGREVEELETLYAEYCGMKHCVGVGNGYDALRISLSALGIGRGDEVIVPSNTYVATWLAVSAAGATPVPVEPNPLTHNIDTSLIEDSIGSRTKAIMPVDLYGQPADIGVIRKLADEHGLSVVVDAAQSHGAMYQGKKACTFSDIACFSFYPTKNLGALGDGGAIVTNNDEIAERLFSLRNYGSIKKYQSKFKGVNSRLDELQAAFLKAKLPFLDKWNAERSKKAKLYSELISGTCGDKGVILPSVPKFVEPVWHLYVVRIKDRTKVSKALERKGVETKVHYPVPPHLQEAYSDIGYRAGSLPVSEQLAGEILSLPLHPFLRDDEIEYIVDSLAASL